MVKESLNLKSTQFKVVLYQKYVSSFCFKPYTAVLAFLSLMPLIRLLNNHLT